MDLGDDLRGQLGFRQQIISMRKVQVREHTPKFPELGANSRSGIFLYLSSLSG